MGACKGPSAPTGEGRIDGVHTSIERPPLQPDLTIHDPPISSGMPTSITTIYTFTWVVRSGARRPAETRAILVDTGRFGGDWDASLNYVRTRPDAPEWGDWMPFTHGGETWQSPELQRGEYVFAVQSRSVSGVPNPFFDLAWNARKVIVDPSVGGPRLVVTNEYLDPQVSTATFVRPVILDVRYGIPLDFCWTADASESGATVAFYRYGWDILDYFDPNDWDTEFIPYDGHEICAPTRAFDFGTHSINVEVEDDRGKRSSIEVRVNVVSRDRLALDLMPGDCENSISANQRGTIDVAFVPHAGVDVYDIDQSTLSLYNNITRMRPERVSIRDVTSPVILVDGCECGRYTDGIPDLVMTFRVEDVVEFLHLGTPDQWHFVLALGMFTDGGPFEGFDCVGKFDGPDQETSTWKNDNRHTPGTAFR